MADEPMGSGSGSTPTSKSDDPAWAHGQVVLRKRNNTICVYCQKHLAGGEITQLKEHLAEIKGNVAACKRVPNEVKWHRKQLLIGWKSNQMRKTTINCEIGSPHGNYVIDEKEEEVETGSPHSSNPTVGTSRKGKESQSNERSKKKKVPNFFPPRTSPRSQPSIRSALTTKERIHQAHLCVARWWFDANILFNVANSKY